MESEKPTIDYHVWYNSWMKLLARNHTRAEIAALLGVKTAEASNSARSHLRAIERTGSMGGNSQARAHSRNVTAAAGDYKIALVGALEIYDLFPQHTKEGEA